MCDMSSELNGLYRYTFICLHICQIHHTNTPQSRIVFLNHDLAKQMLVFSHLVGVKLKTYLVVKKNRNLDTRAFSNKKDKQFQHCSESKHLKSLAFKNKAAKTGCLTYALRTGKWTDESLLCNTFPHQLIYKMKQPCKVFQAHLFTATR